MSKLFKRKFPVVMIFGFALVITPAALASGEKSGFGLGLKKMQDLWRGVTEPTKMTTCRLARKKVYKGEQICVYSGANRTLHGVYNSAGDYCATAMDCKYEPNSDKSVNQLVQDFIDAADE